MYVTKYADSVANGNNVLQANHVNDSPRYLIVNFCLFGFNCRW